jgi:ABC-type lipoprotein release transport system permease subunit
MDRGQVRAMVRWEALIVATIGTVIGTFALITLGAILVVGASATLPARRAGRLDLLQAISAEVTSAE